MKHLLKLIPQFTGFVIVKCSQTGEHHTAKVQDLTRDDESPVSKEDLFEGSSLMLERDRKVLFLKFKGLGSVTACFYLCV